MVSLKERVYGLETEYAVNFYPIAGASSPTPRFLVQMLQECLTQDYGIGHSNFLLTGGKFHHDVGHAEWSLPECRSARELVAYDKAADHLLRRTIVQAEHKLRQAGYEGQLLVAKNNVDSAGNTYGTHENYLMLRDTELLTGGHFLHYLTYCLVPFLVTRQIMIGSGSVRSYGTGRQPVFELSQRARFIDTDVSLETTRSRPIINLGREGEPLAPNTYRRLHLIVGDANLSGWATWMKTATISIVLRMIEDMFIDEIPVFKSPVAALHSIAQDPTCNQTVALRNDQRMSALDIQWRYFELAIAYLNMYGSCNEEDTTISHWERALSDLEKDPMRLRDRADWVMKKSLLDAYLRKQNLSLAAIPADDESVLTQLQYLDLTYHDVSSNGLFSCLWPCDTLLSEEEIRSAQCKPPRYTRAHVRGALATMHVQSRISVTVDGWQTVQVESEKLDLADPLEFDHPRVFAIEKNLPRFIEIALKKAPGDSHLLYLLGCTYTYSLHLKEAVQAFREAIEDFPPRLEVVAVIRRLEHGMENNTLLQGEGRRLAPNVYDIYLSIQDHQQMVTSQDILIRDWQKQLVEFARRRHFTLRTMPVIRLHSDSSLRTGIVRIETEITDRQNGNGESRIATQALSAEQLAILRSQIAADGQPSLGGSAQNQSDIAPSNPISLSPAETCNTLLTPFDLYQDLSPEIYANNNQYTFHIALARALVLQGSYEDAIECYQKAHQLTEKRSLLHFTDMGEAYRYLGRYEEALKAYALQLKITPGDDATHENIGQVYLKIGQIVAAEQEFQLVHEHSPQRHISALALGIIRLSRGVAQANVQGILQAVQAPLSGKQIMEITPGTLCYLQALASIGLRGSKGLPLLREALKQRTAVAAQGICLLKPLLELMRQIPKLANAGHKAWALVTASEQSPQNNADAEQQVKGKIEQEAPWWQEAITHKDEQIRARAVSYALWRKGNEVIPFLKAMLTDDKSTDVQCAVTMALARIGSEEAASILFACLQDPHCSTCVKWAAEEGLEQIRQEKLQEPAPWERPLTITRDEPAANPWGTPQQQQPAANPWGTPQQQQPAWGAPQQQPAANPWGTPQQQQPAADPWGTPQQQQPAWGAPQQQPAANPWGTPQQQQPAANPWGTPQQQQPAWGAPQQQQPAANPWGTPQQQQPAADPWGTPQQQQPAANPWGTPQQQQPAANPWGTPQQQQPAANPWGAPQQQQPAANPWGAPQQQPELVANPWVTQQQPQSANSSAENNRVPRQDTSTGASSSPDEGESLIQIIH